MGPYTIKAKDGGPFFPPTFSLIIVYSGTKVVVDQLLWPGLSIHACIACGKDYGSFEPLLFCAELVTLLTSGTDTRCGQEKCDVLGYLYNIVGMAIFRNPAPSSL